MTSKRFGYAGTAIVELIDASRLQGYTINNDVVIVSSIVGKATLGSFHVAKELETVNINSLIDSSSVKGYRPVLEVFRENNP